MALVWIGAKINLHVPIVVKVPTEIEIELIMKIDNLHVHLHLFDKGQNLLPSLHHQQPSEINEATKEDPAMIVHGLVQNLFLNHGPHPQNETGTIQHHAHDLLLEIVPVVHGLLLVLVHAHGNIRGHLSDIVADHHYHHAVVVIRLEIIVVATAVGHIPVHH